MSDNERPPGMQPRMSESPSPPPPQLWIFFPAAAVERWARSRERREALMAKKLPPELLLRDPALRRSCQLVLQPPGSLMFVAPVSFGVGRGGWLFHDQTDDTPACTGAAGRVRC